MAALRTCYWCKAAWVGPEERSCPECGAPILTKTELRSKVLVEAIIDGASAPEARRVADLLAKKSFSDLTKSQDALFLDSAKNEEP